VTRFQPPPQVAAVPPAEAFAIHREVVRPESSLRITPSPAPTPGVDLAVNSPGRLITNSGDVLEVPSAQEIDAGTDRAVVDFVAQRAVEQTGASRHSSRSSRRKWSQSRMSQIP
jgi:hypothetical protein